MLLRITTYYVLASCIPVYGNGLQAGSSDGVRTIVSRDVTGSMREFEMKRPLMGTLFSIRVYASSPEQAEKVCHKAFAEAERLEYLLSSRDERSELALFNRVPHGTFYPISHNLAKALQTALGYAERTNGAFDPTLGPCIRLWRRSGSRKELPSAEALQKARSASGFKKLKIANDEALKTVPGMKVDLGGIGKGMAVDAMGEILRKEGFPVYCISSTSDVLTGAPPPGKDGWRVALDKEGKNILRVLKNEAVSTSGNMYHKLILDGTVYSHVIDSLTGLGSTHPGNVTVLAPTATEADALSTACSAMNKREALLLISQFPGVEIRFTDNKNASEP